MSGSPGPRGISVGLFQCVSKSNASSGVTAVFHSEAAGTIVLRLGEEDAEYFTVGQLYDFSATQP